VIKIICPPSEENPFAIIDKPSLLPSAPLSDTDKQNAFFEAASIFPELLSVKGRKPCEYGLLHRLDTATRGLLVIAATDSAYERLLESQKNGLFEKTYCAIVEKNPERPQSFPPFPDALKQKLEEGKECAVESYFRAFGEKGKAVRPVTADAGKAALKKSGSRLYTTHIKLCDSGEKAICKIVAGYRHQVRCHLSWAGFPVKGDELYNTRFSGGALYFSAVAVRFPHPLTNEIVEYSL
jgi:23S rRNA pseudouridine1911/1915/1917 synthase